MNKSISLLLGLVLILFVIVGYQLVNEDREDFFETQSNDVVLEVGYISYAPGFVRDPNTGKFSGITYEILEEIAKRKGLTISYKEEVTRSTLVEVLDADRVDMISSPVWMTEPRMKRADFSDPLYFSPIGAYTYAGNTLVTTVDNINNPDVTISFVDGEGGQVIAQEQFPKATHKSFPNNVDVSQMLLEVANKKADVTFVEPIFAYEYMLANPGKLINIAEHDPVQSRANAFMLQKDNDELKLLLNQGIQELIKNGTIDEIIDTYEPFEGSVIRVK